MRVRIAGNTKLNAFAKSPQTHNNLSFTPTHPPSKAHWTSTDTQEGQIQSMSQTLLYADFAIQQKALKYLILMIWWQSLFS